MDPELCGYTYQVTSCHVTKRSCHTRWPLLYMYVIFGAVIGTTLGQTTTAADVNSGSSFDDSTLPVAMVTIAVLAVCIILGILIAKGVDHCHDRRAIRDDASDISEFTKGLLKAQFLYAFNKKLIGKVKGKETVKQRARRMGRIWVGKARKNIRQRKIDEGEIEEIEHKEPGEVDTGVTLVSVKVIKDSPAPSNDKNKSKVTSPRKDNEKTDKSKQGDGKKEEKTDTKQDINPPKILEEAAEPKSNDTHKVEEVQVANMAKADVNNDDAVAQSSDLDGSGADDDELDTSAEKKVTGSPKAKKKVLKGATKKKKVVKKTDKGNTSPKRKRKAGKKTKKKKKQSPNAGADAGQVSDDDEEEEEEGSDDSDDDDDEEGETDDADIENKNNNSRRETADANTPVHTNKSNQSSTKGGATSVKHGQKNNSPRAKKLNKGPVKVSTDENPLAPAVFTIEKETTGSECSSRDDYDFLAEANKGSPKGGRSSKGSSPTRGQSNRSKHSNISVDSSLL